MANPEHVEIVKQGSNAIAKWRRKNPDSKFKLNRANLTESDLRKADLSGADLSEADLSGVQLIGSDLTGATLAGSDLSGVDLSGAVLSGADLSRANLIEADFYEAQLKSADLSRANLTWSKLSFTDLTGANLSKADLSYANLFYTNLTGTDLSEADFKFAIFDSAFIDQANFQRAKFFSTMFADTDLSDATGLEKARHSGPSTIGIDTLYESGGKIPEEFLRGCGVPETMITYARSLVGTPIEFYSCFISYSHEDEEFCKRLHARLRQEGIRVWFAPEEMKGGQEIIDQIDRAIRLHDKVLLVLSDDSMKSKWVEIEIRRARKRQAAEGRKVLFPIGIVPYNQIAAWGLFDSNTGSDMADEVRAFYIPDFSKWKDHDVFEREFAKLARDLQASER